MTRRKPRQRNADIDVDANASENEVLNSESAASTPFRRMPLIRMEDQMQTIVSSISALQTALENIRRETTTNMEELRAQITEKFSEASSAPPIQTAGAIKVPVPTPHTHIQVAGANKQTTAESKLASPCANVSIPTQPPVYSSLPTYTFPTTYTVPTEMQTTTQPSHSENINYGLLPQSYMSERQRLFDLPKFDGRPEEWSLFKTSFLDTTREFNYNNKQNILRLNKALCGAAKSAVTSLLIFPDNVPQVIQELEFNFGRPDILIRSQIDKVKQVPAMSEARIDGVLALSNHLRNMVVLFKSAGCEHHLWNTTLLDELVCKLPPSKQYEWARYAAGLPSGPTVDKFSDWLRDLANVVSLMQTSAATTLRPLHALGQQPEKPSRRVLLGSSDSTSAITCLECGQQHSMEECKTFSVLSTDDKWKVVKNKHLCFGCLKKGHSLSSCRRKQRCSVNGCQRMHNHLLHNHDRNSPKSYQPDSNGHVLNCCQNEEDATLFKIVQVTLSGPAGSIAAYAILDEGSSISLIEADLARKLGLSGPELSLTLQWFGNERKTGKSQKVNVEITGGYKSAQTFSLRSVNTISSLNLPAQTFQKEKYRHIAALPISNYYQAQPKILLGLDNAFLGVSEKVVENGLHQPIAIKTKLGWVAYGPSDHYLRNNPTVLHIRETQSLKEIHKLVNEYFSVENFGVRSTDIIMKSDEEIRAVQILEDTTKRIGDRYETGLLWRSDDTDMPASYDMAKRRLLKVEKRMNTDSQYAEKYIGEINKYIEKGYARLLTAEEAKLEDNRTWYLPHFGVVNPNKPEKLRIVFDAAAKTGETSLNSALIKGPEHAKPLLNILFQFRQGSIAVAGDIMEMFPQIRIREADHNAQRFLWREGKQDEVIQVYAMTSMIFGAICSPCCAEYIKNKNAMEYAAEMPNGASVVVNKTYVDDLVVSFDKQDECEHTVKEAIKINAKAGFILRNFVSNNLQVQNIFNKNENDCHHIVNLERRTTIEKVLGLFWKTTDDTLQYRFQFHKIPREVLELFRPPTKRELLGIIMAVYDPFGLLSNYTTYSKLIMRATWKAAIDWDEPLPNHLNVQFKAWWLGFQNVSHLSIPRCYSTFFFQADDIQLHVFADASSSAYATVAYLRCKKGAQVHTALVAAKSRCAPIKGMTIPRLELQAAILGCRLSESIRKSIEVKLNNIVFWCDNKIVVQWIQSTTRQYKQFVSCRVAEILSISKPGQWRWLPTKLNVADEATRAKLPTSADNNSRWMHGPEFLRCDEGFWPQGIIDTPDDYTVEDSVKLFLLINTNYKPIIDYANYSSYLRVLRITAWILRFIHNTRNASHRHANELTATEISYAEKTICRQIQATCFMEEVSALTSKKCVAKSSDIFKLTPFLDKDGVMKLKGRIDAAICLPLSARNPIILPRDHHVTSLIVSYHHKKRHHQNDYLVINEIRQKFWIPRIRSVLKRIKKACPICQYLKAKPEPPLMGQLPPDRLTPYVRPFTYSGVDYCGPFLVSIGRRREKKWVALFTCLTTRAVHIEVADDLSTDSFLLCLRNFMNRRGTPVKMRSDNGTNFIGAQKELRKENRIFDMDRIQRSLSTENIKWVFNCPANPHAGGCWERLIQCVKRLLSQVFKEEAPKLETFRSTLIEAENIINSRPLADVPTTLDEDEPLTPNHFLLGCLNSTQTPANDNEKVCVRKQWRIAQNLKDRLWKRWVLEYLPRLICRPKWRQEVRPLRPGQLVIVCDPSLPRSQWLKGRVSRVFPAKDGQIRRAEVMTRQGLLRRPTTRLAALEYCESSPPQDSPGPEDVNNRPL